MTDKAYFLGTGEQDKLRLEILGEVYNPASKEFLTACGLKDGMEVLDLGCGSGIITAWIAQQLAPTGTVTGIDLSEEQIDLAKDHAAKLNIRNIVFTRSSAYDLSQLQHQFDLIYSRFLLVHLANPNAALKAVYESLKPGGMISCECAIHSHSFSDPAPSAYEQFIKWAIQLFAAQGKDADIGKSMHARLSELGFEDIKLRIYQPLLTTTREKSMMVFALQNAKDYLMQESIAEVDEVDQLIQQMIDECNNSQLVWAAPSICQIRGVKPS